MSRPAFFRENTVGDGLKLVQPEKKTPAGKPSGGALSISTFNRRSTWDAKFTAKRRTVVAALGRMANQREATHTATFRLSADSSVAKAAAKAAGKMATSVTIRFPVEQSLMETQQEIAQRFGWDRSAIIFLADAHEWERPVLSASSLQAAFEEWEAQSGARTRAKYDLLVVDVEEYLTSAQMETQLRGAGASWEIACRDTHHDLLSNAFLHSLHALLSSQFAPATHAAAAINMLIQVPQTLARFPRRLIESLDKALRTSLHPPPAAVLAALCRGSPAFLAR